MSRKLALPLALAGIVASSGIAAALVHHGWNEYDAQTTLVLTGTVENIRFSNPHVMVGLRTGGQGGRLWEAVLAPPSRMQARGLPMESLHAGMSARVVGYPHKKTKGEMRAERIIVDNDTTELR